MPFFTNRGIMPLAGGGGGGITVVFDVTGGTTGSPDTGYAGYTFVQIVPGSLLAAATGTQVRLTLKFTELVPMVVSVYMAKQGAGDVYDFLNTPAHILFSGTDITGDTVTLDYVSDWTNLPEAYDEAANYVMALQCVGAGPAAFATKTGVTGIATYYKLVTDAATVDKSGYTSNTSNQATAWFKIEIQ